ncbi:ribonuclease H1 domain-containing protein [Flavilitoribacter nigricans]|uniref:Ribonuclease H n=1 Tax=Flavilitoribacter nigricans (strain ATCC 23147 / DSM 23189 / NBRC 102662 / NCIMB 1420 / SS-2) TaxID=1122177 RepID=A0A2D0N121_FLAN2|nr:ribonuclease H family protein [Flavilitoribacter nigricans]PHN02066.1 ribonuclease H [Flavilitoribacter nigricans DSM 23189 = NBRC 102662]
MTGKKKYYVVWQGNQPGIYESWTECQLQIKGFPNAKYKAFKTKEEAEQAYRSGYTFTPKAASAGTKKPTSVPDSARKDIVWDSIAVDAACSGNPGVMEYQGVDTKSGMQIFHQKFALGTNNIGEFLAIVHALAMFQKQGKNTPIYTDSRIAMGWVKRKKAKTTLKHSPKTARLHELIQRAETWLKNNTYKNPILKWETESWGEIPADFGRK